MIAKIALTSLYLVAFIGLFWILWFVRNSDHTKHRPRVIGILDNMVAASITAFFVGLLLPYFHPLCEDGGAIKVDWLLEFLLAIGSVIMYAAGMALEVKKGDEE